MVPRDLELAMASIVTVCDIRLTKSPLGILGHDFRQSTDRSPFSEVIDGAPGGLASWFMETNPELRMALVNLTTLERLHGVGDVLANSLRDIGFDTLVDIAGADNEELTRVHGIGTIRAEELRQSAQQIIHEEEYRLEGVPLREV